MILSGQDLQRINIERRKNKLRPYTRIQATAALQRYLLDKPYLADISQANAEKILYKYNQNDK